MIIEYPIAKDYIEHWGLWEAIRELIQNGLDAERRGYTLKIHKDEEGMVVATKGICITPQTLILGNSNKGEDDIGKFGEGYKLALLVLLRLGYKVEVHTGAQKWTPFLEYSEFYDSEILKINIEELSPIEDTIFLIYGDIDLDLDKYFIKEDNDIILKDRPGEIFVSGLFICKLDKLKYGYNFSPNRIKLNRDRNLIGLFDVLYEGTSLIETYLSEDEIIDLLEEDSHEVIYYTPKKKLAEKWVEKNPNTIPIYTSEQAKEVPKDKEVKLVPRKLGEFLRSVFTFSIPKKKTPKEKLIDFMAKYDLTQDQIKDLRKILEDME